MNIQDRITRCPKCKMLYNKELEECPMCEVLEEEKITNIPEQSEQPITEEERLHYTKEYSRLVKKYNSRVAKKIFDDALKRKLKKINQ